MYSDGWTWYPLTAHAFATLLTQGGVITTGSTIPTSCTLFSREEGRITLGFTTGVPEEIAEHGKYLRALAFKRGEKVRALVPKRSELASTLQEVGFQSAGTILVYEKQLHSPHVKKS
jgi:hypothetical protein